MTEPDRLETQPLRILVVGAHPDDCDYKAGGTAAFWKRGGHDVRFISLTDGRSGHQRLSGAELVAIRRKEAAAAGQVIGIRYDVLNFPDGGLEPTLEARTQMISLIREYRPDLVLTHRPNDYHPDHRATAQLVCDAAYMVTVPPVVPEVPALRDNPVMMYLSDDFERPYPFTPTVAVDVEPMLGPLVDMLDCHTSQFYDWLAYNHHYADDLPEDAEGRKAFLARLVRARLNRLADRHRPLLLATYGSQAGVWVKYIEAFEWCEYGAPLTAEARRRLFPFVPQSGC